MKRAWWVVLSLLVGGAAAVVATYALAARSARERGSFLATDGPREPFPEPGADPYGEKLAADLLPPTEQGDAGVLVFELPGVSPQSRAPEELALLRTWEAVDDDSDPGLRDTLNRLADHPAASDITRIARKKSAIVVGVALPFDETSLMMTARMPDYMAVAAWTRALARRAVLFEQRGHPAEAEGDLIATVAASRALQRDSTLIALVTGQALEARSAERLAGLKKRTGDPQQASRWLHLARDAHERREVSRRFVRYLQGSWGEESVADLSRVAARKDLPLAWRFESMTAIGEGWLTVPMETWLGPAHERTAVLQRIQADASEDELVRKYAGRMLRSLAIPFSARVN